MERAGGSQYVHFEAIDTTSGNRRPSDAANITPYCVIDNGTPNPLSTTTVIEWSAAKSGTGIYAMQPTGAEANGKNILYFAISSTPNTRCIPVAVAMNPDGFSQCMSGGALVNGVTVQFNNDKVGYSLSATGLALTTYVPPTTALTESYSALHANPSQAQLLFEIRSLLAEKSVTGTVLTANKIDGSTPAMTFTLSSATAPTSITRTT